MTSTQDTDTGTQDPAATNPAIGRDVDANGIRTNYLEAGSGDQTIVFVHGSGPGVTAYANWRGVLPVLGEHFRCVAPDMVGFGYSERPENAELQPRHLGRPDPRRDGRPRHREGAPGGQQLRRRHRAAAGHQAPGPGRQDGPDGLHGGPVRDHRGARQRLGLPGHARAHEVGHGLLRLRQVADQRRPRPGPLRGRDPAGLPGVVLLDVPGTAPALGGVDDGGRTTRSAACRTAR